MAKNKIRKINFLPIKWQIKKLHQKILLFKYYFYKYFIIQIIRMKMDNDNTMHTFFSFFTIYWNIWIVMIRYNTYGNWRKIRKTEIK